MKDVPIIATANRIAVCHSLRMSSVSVTKMVRQVIVKVDPKNVTVFQISTSFGGLMAKMALRTGKSKLSARPVVTSQVTSANNIANIAKMKI